MIRQLAAVSLLFLVASIADASTISLGNSSLDTLVEGTASPVGPSQVSDMLNANGSSTVLAEVTNQVYTGDNGLYIYLYQIENKGVTAIETFTLWPFLDANDSTSMGWLSDASVPDFSSGGQVPEPEGFVSTAYSDPVLSFYYSSRAGCEIAPSETSAVMYVVSELPPGLTNGNVISGSVGTGEVFGPVPEPSMAVYLILGGLGLLAIRRLR